MLTPALSFKHGVGFSQANRREARKLGLLHKQKSEAERERMEPLERNERVCGEYPDTNANPNGKFGIKLSCLHMIAKHQLEWVRI